MAGSSRASGNIAALLTVVLVLGCTPSPTPSTGSGTPTGSGAVGSPGASGRAVDPSPTAFAGTPIRWVDCGQSVLCGDLRVPKDYANPSLGTLNIAVVRIPSTGDADERIGSLIINPGGPGASGVEFARSPDLFPRRITDRFDIVGFDPRGVGQSSTIRCIDNLDGRAQLDPSPDTAAEIDALVEDARVYAEACERRNGPVLPYLSTDAVVDDLELLRQAVGDERLTYLGFSYGTLIGARYADRYPDHIRAMALDGAMDPSLSLRELRAGQAVAFEGALERFLEDCSDDRSCPFHGGGNVARAFDRLMAAIDRDPLPTPSTRDPRSVGPGLAQSAVLGAMYSEAYWPSLALALAAAEEGDGSILLLISDPFRGRKENGSYSNQQDAYFGNICLDFPIEPDVAAFGDLQAALEDDAPRFAGQIAYNDLTCSFWPVPATGVPAAVSAPGAPPLLVVGSTGDTATPYAWSESLAEQLDATLLTRRGEGHTGYLASECVADAVEAYLIEVEVPDEGTVCRE